jgi:dihydrofolate reductase
MTRVVAEISVSLDGFVAGPNPSLEEPLGEGGELLHTWVTGLAPWRERHGLTGGAENADSELVAASIAAQGAIVMGRRMFSGGDGPWEADPNAEGWWGDDPPFRASVFVVTHHPREQVDKDGGVSYTFVTEGIATAIERARAAAGEKDVYVVGGASVIQQALAGGLVDDLMIHLVPVLLGSGTRMFGDGFGSGVQLEIAQVVDSPAVTHLRYRVGKAGSS